MYVSINKFAFQPFRFLIWNFNISIFVVKISANFNKFCIVKCQRFVIFISNTHKITFYFLRCAFQCIQTIGTAIKESINFFWRTFKRFKRIAVTTEIAINFTWCAF